MGYCPLLPCLLASCSRLLTLDFSHSVYCLLLYPLLSAHALFPDVAPASADASPSAASTLPSRSSSFIDRTSVIAAGTSWSYIASRTNSSAAAPARSSAVAPRCRRIAAPPATRSRKPDRAASGIAFPDLLPRCGPPPVARAPPRYATAQRAVRAKAFPARARVQSATDSVFPASSLHRFTFRQAISRLIPVTRRGGFLFARPVHLVGPIEDSKCLEQRHRRPHIAAPDRPGHHTCRLQGDRQHLPPRPAQPLALLRPQDPKKLPSLIDPPAHGRMMHSRRPPRGDNSRPRRHASTARFCSSGNPGGNSIARAALPADSSGLVRSSISLMAENVRNFSWPMRRLLSASRRLSQRCPPVALAGKPPRSGGKRGVCRDGPTRRPLARLQVVLSRWVIAYYALIRGPQGLPHGRFQGGKTLSPVKWRLVAH